MKGYHDNYSVTIQVCDRKVVVIDTCTTSVYLFCYTTENFRVRTRTTFQLG